MGATVKRNICASKLRTTQIEREANHSPWRD